MKKALLILLTLMSCVSFAAEGHLKGKVQYVRVHGEQEFPAWTPPTFWFTLEGVTSAGACKTWHGNVLFVMDSDMAFSLVLASQMAGREIAVRYDDTKLNVEKYWCKATYVTTGDPAPLL